MPHERVGAESPHKFEHIHLRQVGAVSALKRQSTPLDDKPQRPLVHIPLTQVDSVIGNDWHVQCLLIVCALIRTAKPTATGLRRGRKTSQQVEDVLFLDLPGRLANQLLRLIGGGRAVSSFKLTKVT
jgi:hypothetical protein